MISWVLVAGVLALLGLAAAIRVVLAFVRIAVRISHLAP